MEVGVIGPIFVLLMFLFLFLGFPVFVAMMLVAGIGLWLSAGHQAVIGMFTVVPYETTASFLFSVIPFFIIMGNFASMAGMALELYNVGEAWAGGLPGGLACATVIGNAFFGACSGSSLAATATFSRIALPEMLRRKYAPTLACGSIAAAGTLAVLIPPTGLFVIYSMLTDAPLGPLIIAGYPVGITLTLFYIATIVIWAKLGKVAPKPVGTSWRAKLNSIRWLLFVTILIAIIAGGMFTGVFTPTEAGAAGAFACFIIWIVRGTNKGFHGLNEALRETVVITGRIFLIIIGAFMLGRSFAIAGITPALSAWITGLPISTTLVVVCVMLFYAVLGCFMDAAGMLALSLPILWPPLEALGVDPIWFGILVTIAAEMALVTPPVGLTCFVVKSVAGDAVTLGQVFRGIFPFFIADFVLIFVIIFFPAVVLWLPSLMWKV